MGVLNSKKVKKTVAIFLISIFTVLGRSYTGIFKPVYSNAETSVSSTPLSYSNITIDVVDTDIRDVLTLFSLSIGKSIVFIEKPVNATFRAENVDKMQAFELFLKAVDLSYYDYGNVIVVGKKDKMPQEQSQEQQVQEQSYLTRLDLNYISAKVAIAQFDSFGLDLQKVAIDANPKMIWMNAALSQLAKANEIIQAIDIPENAEIKEPIVFKRIDLKYITADSALTMLGGLFDDLKAIRGVQDDSKKDSTDPDDKSKVLYLNVTQSRLDEIKAVLEKLDIPENGAINIFIQTIQLKYTNSDVVTKMAEKAEITAKIVTSDTNKKLIWGIGKKEDLDKLQRFITNVDIPQNETEGVTLEKISLKYITADKVNSMIQKFSVSIRLYWVDENPMMLMIMGAESNIAAFKHILTQIDVSENVSETAKIVSYKLTYISAADVKKTIEQLGMKVTLFNMDTNTSVLWAKGQEKDLNELSDIISKLDTQENAGVKDGTTINVFRFNNITAKTAVTRLNGLGLSGIKMVLPNYEQYERFIIIIYPNSMDAILRNAVGTIDAVEQKIKVPVDYSDGANGVASLQARRDLLSQLTGVPAESFQISGNVSRDYSNPHYILWLEDTSDNIKKVRDMVDSIEKP